MLKFMVRQSTTEMFLALFFLVLLLYAIIVLVLKMCKRKKSFFMLKYRDLFNSITFVILGVSLVFGSLVARIVDSIIVYFGLMLVSAFIINLIIIGGGGIKRIKDIEFAEVTSAYESIIKYCDLSDQFNTMLLEFIEYLNCIDEDEVSNMDFNEFTRFWASCIKGYMESRIDYIDYIEQPNNKNKLFNYIKDRAAKYDLWYKDENFRAFTEDVYKGKEVVLAENMRIIPITTKRFKCIFFVVGVDKVKDIDSIFLKNTYTILSLL